MTINCAGCGESISFCVDSNVSEFSETKQVEVICQKCGTVNNVEVET